MKLATLNIRHGGGRRLPRLFAVFERLAVDILVLTEYRENDNATATQRWLLDAGFAHLATSSRHPRQNGLLMVFRFPFETQATPAESSPIAHRLIHARFARFDLIGVYFPQGRAKAPLFDYLQDGLPASRAESTLLLGDLNTGLHHIDEGGRTFACEPKFRGLLADQYVDAWRRRNPQVRDYTWYSTKGNGFRIDHALATPAFDQTIVRIVYDHATRTEGATDHSALIVETHHHG